MGQKDRFLPQVTDVIDAVVAGGIDLHNIHQAAVIHPTAAFTFPAGTAVVRIQTVDRLGDQLGAGGLAGAPAAHQQIGMGGFALQHFVFQRGGDRLLPHDLFEGAGSPLAVQRLIQRGAPPLPKMKRQPLSYGNPVGCGTRKCCLMLLGSPPDMVHSTASHRTRFPHDKDCLHMTCHGLLCYYTRKSHRVQPFFGCGGGLFPPALRRRHKIAQKILLDRVSAPLLRPVQNKQ